MRRCFISYIFFINRCGCKRMQAICKKGTSNKMMTRSRLEHYYSYKISLIYFFLKLQLIKEENIRGVVTLNEDYETSIFMHSKEVNHYFMHGPKLLKLNTTTKYEHYNKLQYDCILGAAESINDNTRLIIFECIFLYCTCLVA